MTIKNQGGYTSSSVTSVEIAGNISSGNSPAGRVDFINGLTPTSIARIEGITSSGSTIQGGLRFIVNNGTLNEAVRIDPTGRVGIGMTGPGYQLELSTNSAGKPTSSTWTITSDERLKNIEGNYSKGLSEIIKLQPISYHYKNVGEKVFDESVLKEQAIGFSAQEVQKIFPEAVRMGSDGYLNLDIHPILIAYVNAIKQQQEMIKKQQEQIDLLLKKVEAIETKSEQK